MTAAVALRTGQRDASLADLAAERLAVALDRLAAWRAQRDGNAAVGWRADFARWCTSDSDGQRFNALLASASARLDASGDGATRRRLRALFRLDLAECDLLDCALAIAAEPDLLERLGGALTQQAVTALFGHANCPLLRPTSPLARWLLVEQGPAGIAIDPDIAALLTGKPGLDRVLARCAAVIDPPRFALEQWPLDATLEAVMRLNEMGRSVRVLLAALPGNGRQMFAAALAEELSSRVIRVSPGADPDPEIYLRAQRMALLTGHAIYWDGAMPSSGEGVASAPLQFVAVPPLVALPPVAGLVDLPVELPVPNPVEKAAVWQALGGTRDGVTLEGCGRTALSARLTDVVALAEHAPTSNAAARAILARRIRARVEGSGNLLALPYRRDDLVLTPAAAAQFDAIVAELGARERLLTDPALAAHYGRLGQSILFHGPSGLGKTMCAQVLASELGADLVRVDCASIVSKYIGETAKQLRDLFDRLRGSGAVAFFDEADSLFASRTELKEANDRHANADTNYLLQLIEDFDGIAILATNRRDNIDPAFLRRLRYVVEFGDLGADARASLWLKHLAALTAGVAPPDWSARLALVELTPAQIKGAALSGHFIGDARGDRAPALGHFLAGIERELAKDGHALDSGLRRRIADG